jgi:hypothetical protein
MGSKHVAGLVLARHNQAFKVPALTSAVDDGANCNLGAMPEASFTSRWYLPERLMSQSERLPS